MMYLVSTLPVVTSLLRPTACGATICFLRQSSAAVNRAFHSSATPTTGYNLSVQSQSYRAENAMPFQVRVDMPLHQNVHNDPKVSWTGLSHAYIHPVVKYRSVFPESMWCWPTNYFRERNVQFPSIVDIGAGHGRGALELAKRGFRVTSVESSPSLQAGMVVAAEAMGCPVQTVGARQASNIPSGSKDMVTFIHGLHHMDSAAALREAFRICRPGGLVMAAWNDRDLSSAFVSELEGVLERYNPKYSRYQKQRDPSIWHETLAADGLLTLLHYQTFPNSIRMKNAQALLDIFDGMSFVREVLKDEERVELNANLASLAREFFDGSAFELPLVSRMYIMQKACDADDSHPWEF